ncbi:MAG: hypothetical protein JXA83_01990 [Acidimicrobiales bacterium]|nr:hypothetical protein [Acidimicrobiales bacterium]
MTPDDQRPEHPEHPGEGAAAPDELASALLDGALDPAEAAAARQRPEVVARVAELEAVRAALRSVPAPDPAARERAVAAALAAFDDAGGGDANAHATAAPGAAGQGALERPAEARVTHLRPRRPAGGPRRWLGAAAAAALVVAGAAGVAVLGSDDGGRDDAEVASSGTSPESGTEPDELGESAPSDDDASAGGGQADAQVDEQLATPDAVARDLGDLGAFATDAELVDHVTAIAPEVVADDGASASPEAGADGFDAAARSLGDLVERCAGGLPPPLDAPDASVLLRGRATVAGHGLDVVVVDVAGATRVVALDADCAVEVDQPLR